jgi:MFS family permease
VIRIQQRINPAAVLLAASGLCLRQAWRVSSTFMSLIAVSQVFGLLLSGYLAQMLGIRPVFIACAGALAVISAAGYFLLRGRTPHPAKVDVQESATTRSSAGNQ